MQHSISYQKFNKTEKMRSSERFLNNRAAKKAQQIERKKLRKLKYTIDNSVNV